MTFFKMMTAVGGAVMALTLSASAQDTLSPNEVRDRMSRHMVRTIERGPDRAIERFASTMYSIDPSGNVNVDTLARHVSLLVAENRARKLRELLEYDLDFDGSLTPEELEIARAYSAAKGRRGVGFMLMAARADGNADGTLSYDEILGAVRMTETKAKLRSSSHEKMREYMIFDANGDGTATLAEMVMMVEQQRLLCNC